MANEERQLKVTLLIPISRRANALASRALGTEGTGSQRKPKEECLEMADRGESHRIEIFSALQT